MGCLQSAEQREQKAVNDQIEQQLKDARMQAQKEVKMLLLGAGESGKSTILKQMQLIHGVGYSDEERLAYKEIIYSNVIQSMKVILEAMEMLGIALGRRGLKEDTLAAEVANAVKALWADSGVQACFQRSREYQLNDSAKYYFDAMDRLADANFVPTDQDILRSRVKTTGIVETTFRIQELTYRMFDVGGQRSERKKWIHCFENVTAIVFLVAISEYDQVLVEDETVNRMQEALTLFDSICNSRWFVKTSIILFLNKIDLFKTKITRSPIEKFFPEYTGGDNFDAACQFFLDKFQGLNQTPESKQIYAHFTCATDTNQIRFVMAAVNDIIIKKNLEDCGLL
ncbi:guanine nucleotide-binding protein subunit alpha [Allomyces macrogynus ATCC 38327]|uniref:Guanine nucleotide-binding protein alpha-16 subunit n=1 Tax=Allomyces macrogynus (strain ATCC 38327) TaxID=578462 RepID=A0A0L0S9J6_ALLM3|nr:guanine nucleotide-binding protein subunit alpha [Allomyces macrogynus ATCC 38327]|eukprot:KNE59273.1 guanine nucleotide-binding protein subunit alpha [Allomyces macrogynus ATCC 38327]